MINPWWYDDPDIDYSIRDEQGYLRTRFVVFLAVYAGGLVGMFLWIFSHP